MGSGGGATRYAMTVPYTIQITDAAGTSIGTVRFGESYYELGSLLLPVDARIVWCAPCNAFSSGERLDDEARRATRLTKMFWRHHADDRSKFMEDALLSRLRRDASERMAWYEYLRRRRVSPPRCLNCGSTEIVAVDEEREERAYHPAGTGHIGFATGIRYSTAMCIVYTPEGIRLRQTD
jgi:hypothetical protein